VIRLNKFVSVAASGAIIAGSMSIGVASANAYDKEAFAYSASHFLNESQLPKAFAAKKGINVNISAPTGKSFVCSSGDTPNVRVWLAKPVRTADASYNLKSKALDLEVMVSEYSSNGAAEKAFAQLSKDISKCDGKFTGSIAGDDGEAPMAYETVITSGKIPKVTVVGVQSIFTNLASQNSASGDVPAFLSDSKSIYTLVNNVVIMTSASTLSAQDLTSKQKDALTQVAFDMVDAWIS